MREDIGRRRGGGGGRGRVEGRKDVWCCCARAGPTSHPEGGAGVLNERVVSRESGMVETEKDNPTLAFVSLKQTVREGRLKLMKTSNSLLLPSPPSLSVLPPHHECM